MVRARGARSIAAPARAVSRTCTRTRAGAPRQLAGTLTRVRSCAVETITRSPVQEVRAPSTRSHPRARCRSGGVSDYGGAEIHDIDAVLALARRDGHAKVVTIGTSQGGIAVLRHAGLLGGVDAVVGISSLAYWDWRGGADPLARRQLDARIGSRSGRAALRAWGVRLPEQWDEPESPEEVVGKISPTPVAIIHGNDDHLFAPDHARRLYEAAGEPKRLLLGDRFGHAEDGLTPAFATRLARIVFEMLELPWSE